MNESENSDSGQVPAVTCSGGITLPSLEVLFGQRPEDQEEN